MKVYYFPLQSKSTIYAGGTASCMAENEALALYAVEEELKKPEYDDVKIADHFNRDAYQRGAGEMEPNIEMDYL
jgi:hypothetical protein